MSKMHTPQAVKLLHVTTVPQSLAFLRGQTGYMKAKGIDVAAASSAGHELELFAFVENVSVYAIEMARRITPRSDIASVGRLIKLLKRERPTIVHSHTPKGGLLGMVSSYLARVPVRIYHIRGLPYMTATGRKRALLKTTERVSCYFADRVFCVSHSIRDVAIRDGICSPEKVFVFGAGSGNGVDAEGRFNPNNFSREERRKARQHLGIDVSAPVIGFVGRLVRDKGIHELSTAWKVIREAYPMAHLVLVGPLERQDPIDPDVLSRLRTDDRVHLLGSVDDSSATYSIFDLLVLPTYREGFPNVPLEAAAMKLPVVATTIPGCMDAVQDGVTGTLVPPRDVDALRTAIEKYLDDPLLRQRHGNAGRERVLREFRQEEIWEAIYQEYLDLLTQKGFTAPMPCAVGYSPTTDTSVSSG